MLLLVNGLYLNRAVGVVQTACGLDGWPADPSLNLSFSVLSVLSVLSVSSVSSVSSVVNPRDSERESNLKGHGGRRELLCLNRVRVGLLGGTCATSDGRRSARPKPSLQCTASHHRRPGSSRESIL